MLSTILCNVNILLVLDFVFINPTVSNGMFKNFGPADFILLYVTRKIQAIRKNRFCCMFALREFLRKHFI